MAEQLLKFKVDASKGGCTGLFWRTGPSDSKVSHQGDWPRNGTVLEGTLPKEHPGWVKLTNGFWLPIENHGKVAVHQL